MNECHERMKFVKDASKECENLNSILEDSSSSIKTSSVNAKVKGVSYSSKAGNKLSALGTALIIILPEPTGISDVIGGIMVISGQYIQRKSSANIKETFESFNRINAELRKARMSY